MAEQEMSEEKTSQEAERSPLYEMTRRVLLAGIGAVALAQEEAESFIKRLVERGELAEKEGKKLVRELLEKRKREAQRAEDELDKRIRELLSRMNVPTKADIESLSAKVTELAKKIDELKKS